MSLTAYSVLSDVMNKHELMVRARRRYTNANRKINIHTSFCRCYTTTMRFRENQMRMESHTKRLLVKL